MAMDIGREEASLVYEERLKGSSSPHEEEGSEDEDTQRELEERLYSHVYFDNSSCTSNPVVSEDNPQSSAQNAVIENITTQEIITDEPGFASSEPSNVAGVPVSDLKFQSICSRSQFNHPGRKAASRYYDDHHQVLSLGESTFIAPKNPHQKRNYNSSSDGRKFSIPSTLSSKILARSSNEVTYNPRASPMGERSKMMTEDSFGGIQNETTRNKQSRIDTQAPVEEFNVTDKLEESGSVDSVALSLETTVDKLAVTSVEKVSDGNNSKTDLVQTPVTSHKKASQLSFEAKVSKVISSMLDDESRSSADDNHSVSKYTAQDLKNSGSGWSVGMSWDDMSSKYCFEADSLEEESVSSLQLQEGTPADCRINTPEIQATFSERDEDEYDDTSRYNLNLKEKDEKCGEKEVEDDSDSDSDRSSVVEVSAPAKSPPPLVDISDGEFAPSIDVTIEKPHRRKGRDISLIPFNQSHSGSVPEVVIDSSSEDDVAILDGSDSHHFDNVMGQAKTSHPTLDRSSSSVDGSRRTHSTSDENKSSMCGGPSQHVTHHKGDDAECSAGLISPHDERQALHNSSVATSTDIQQLQYWLHDPITSTDYLDHKRFLQNMSDDPKLWRIIREDQFPIESPRGPKCTRCKEFGHKVRNCPNPPKVILCHMCGVSGHSEGRCPQKMCLKCGRKNNVFVDHCRECAFDKMLCKICSSTSHVWKVCPDLWRRYHLTTTSGTIVEPPGRDIRPVSEHWCSNCTAKGHLSHECKQSRWKCEHISPLIFSYSSINEVEENLDGPSSVTMLLTDNDAAVLSSVEGNELLRDLSVKFEVTIHSNLETTFKKIVISGTSMSQAEVRLAIYRWIKSQKANTNKAVYGEELESCLSYYGGLPRKGVALASFINRELRTIIEPLHNDMSVKKLFARVQKLKGHKRAKERRKLCRLMSIILLGKCGFEDGPCHINALKKLVRQLYKVSGDVDHDLRLETALHYCSVFKGIYRKDFPKLVKQFYSNEELVKKYDPVRQPNPELLQKNVQQSAISDHKKLELLASSSEDELTLDCLNSSQPKPSKESFPGMVGISSPGQEDGVSLKQMLNEEQEVSNVPSKRALRAERWAKSRLNEQEIYNVPTYSSRALRAKRRADRKDQAEKNYFSKLESNLRRDVPIVLKNLSSRFITCKEQIKLTKLFKEYFNSTTPVQNNRKNLETMARFYRILCNRFQVWV